MMRLSILTIGFMGLATSAAAEVRDKIPTYEYLAFQMLTAALIVFFAFRAGRYKLGSIVLAFALLATCFFIDDGLHDPYVGPAIHREMGLNYVALAYVSPVMITIAASLGLFLGYRSRRRL